MTERKNPKLDVRNYKGLFFNIGLVTALGLTLMAFEWKTVDPGSTVVLGDSIEDDIIFEPPVTKHTPPPPPKVKDPVIIEVSNEIEIEEDILIDLNVDVDEEDIIEVIVSTDMPEDEDVTLFHGVVEQQPRFMNGGQEEFLKYVGSKLKYPSLARRIGIEGKVFVQFVVDKSGKMTDIEVVKGIGAGCDEEVLRVLNDAPAWEAGKQRGKPVKVRMIVPVAFRLN